MTILTAQVASAGTFVPEIADDGFTMIGLTILLMLNWVDADGKPRTTTQRAFDAWSMLNDQQRANLQEIHDVIAQGVMGQV